MGTSAAWLRTRPAWVEMRRLVRPLPSEPLSSASTPIAAPPTLIAALPLSSPSQCLALPAKAAASSACPRPATRASPPRPTPARRCASTSPRCLSRLAPSPTNACAPCLAPSSPCSNRPGPSVRCRGSRTGPCPHGSHCRRGRSLSTASLGSSTADGCPDRYLGELSQSERNALLDRTGLSPQQVRLVHAAPATDRAVHRLVAVSGPWGRSLVPRLPLIAIASVS